jgi:hypothetical protein
MASSCSLAWARIPASAVSPMPSTGTLEAASSSMVSMPASASLARWVTRIPATSSTSRLASISASHVSQCPQTV